MKTKVILVVDDENLVRWSIKHKLEGAGYQVLEASDGSSAMTLFKENMPDMVTLDVRLPDTSGLKVLLEMKKLAPATPIIMITAYGAVDDAVKALQIGSYDYLEKPINFERLIHSLSNALETTKLRTQVERTKQEQEKTHSVERIVGESKTIREVKTLVRKVTDSEASTILIEGESGTGKDLVAKALHYQSRRRNQPFVVLNCAAIPEHLLENELFGHESGAFTDAKTLKKGLFELADGGSVFFDEISGMHLNLQSKLLRVLEDQTFRRIGGLKDITTNVRVICASNKDLEKMAAKGEFREDLFYRLSVIPILMPPLRERKGDIPLLVKHFVQEYNVRFSKSIKGVPEKTMKILEGYDWPGNVRELRNAIERAMILQDEGYIDEQVFPLRISAFGVESKSLLPDARLSIPSQGINLYELEADLIRQALVKAGGNQTQASRFLSITRDTLRYKMKKYGLGKHRSAALQPTPQ